MRWRFILSALTATLLAVLAAVVVVAAVVPLGFAVAVPGRVVPACEVRVTAPADGRLLELRAPGAVAAGDLLFRLDSEADQCRLAALDRELSVLREREEHEAAQIAAAACLRQADLELLDLRQRRLTAERDALSGPLAAAEEKLRANEAEQLRVDDDLAASESDILRRLAAELSVPAMELARGQARAAKTALMRRHSDLDASRLDEERQAAVLQLQLQVEEAQAEADRIRLQVDDQRQRLDLRAQIVRGEAEQAALRRAIARQTASAPWAGTWCDRACEPGEFLTSGTRVGILRREAPLHVVGQAREADIAWLRVGQRAHVRVAAFPVVKYGRLDGRVVRLEARSGAAAASFLVDVELPGGTLPYTPFPGQQARLDVVVFNGTLMRYLAAEPGAADDGSGRQGRPVDLLRLILRR